MACSRLMPFKIVAYAQQLGFEVFINSNPKLCDLTGIVMLSPDMMDELGTDKVLIIKEGPLPTVRFNIALGIAYYQLDFNPDKDMEYCKTFDTRTMSYVGAFNILSRACEILLPKDIFTKRFNKYKKRPRYDIIRALVKEFEVPQGCVIHRLYDLQLERN